MAKNIQIVVVQRGWVFIGDVVRNDREFVIERSMCIRRWGTERGLGQLEKGPTTETVLDPYGTVRMHPLSVVFTIDVDQAAWEKKLPAES